MIFLRKESLPSTGAILVTTDAESEKLLGKMKDGQTVAVTAKRARSPRHNRKFFAMLNNVYNNQDQFRSVDDLLDAVKLEVGHSELKERLNGERWREPKSISFYDMGQDEFNKFYDAAMDKLCIHFKLDRELLEQESSERLPPSSSGEGPSPTAATSLSEDEQQPPLGDGPTPDSEKPEDAPETPTEKSSPDAPGKPDEVAVGPQAVGLIAEIARSKTSDDLEDVMGRFEGLGDDDLAAVRDAAQQRMSEIAAQVLAAG